MFHRENDKTQGRFGIHSISNIKMVIRRSFQNNGFNLNFAHPMIYFLIKTFRHTFKILPTPPPPATIPVSSTLTPTQFISRIFATAYGPFPSQLPRPTGNASQCYEYKRIKYSIDSLMKCTLSIFIRLRFFLLYPFLTPLLAGLVQNDIHKSTISSKVSPPKDLEDKMTNSETHFTKANKDEFREGVERWPPASCYRGAYAPALCRLSAWSALSVYFKLIEAILFSDVRSRMIKSKH